MIDPRYALEVALAHWNLQQPAWTRIKRYEELTAAEQSRVDDLAEQIEFEQLILSTEDSIRRIDC